MLRHYAVYTEDTHFAAVLDFIELHQLDYSIHLNRTRFWIDDSDPLHSLLILNYPSSVVCIESETNHTLGV